MLIEFFLQNAILAVTVLLLGAATVYLWTVGGDKSVLDADQAVEAINYEHAQVYDLRSKEEFNKGHIPGAKHLAADKAADKLPGLAKKNPVLLVCAKGNIATTIARKLRANGVENSLTLKGGIAAWQQDGKPITKK